MWHYSGFIQHAQHPLPVYTQQQIQQWEQDWFNQGNSSFGLMQQAAWQVCQWCNNHYKPRQVTVFVGGGNNGGDGWLTGWYLAQHNVGVTIVEVAEAKASGDASLAKATVLANMADLPLTIRAFADIPQDIMDCAPLLNCEVIIDAVFGIGLNRQPQGAYADAIKRINQAKQWSKSHQKEVAVISIDLPSGLMADTGQVFSSYAVQATTTLCLVGLKVGLLYEDGRDVAGNIELMGLIPNQCLGKDSQVVQSLSPLGWYHAHLRQLPCRSNNSYKGTYGHVLVIGGNTGMAGAGILAASSAIGVGAGKVTLACDPTAHTAVNASYANVMTADIHDLDRVTELIETVDVVIIGMGLGRDEVSAHKFAVYLTGALEAQVDIVIDADGLYLLSKNTDLSALVTNSATPIWYTPHSGEAAELLNISYACVNQDKVAAIQRLHQRYGGHWLLKGSGSMVLQSDGLHISGRGNAGMATAGMGDVLAGIAGGLRAQNHLEATLLDAMLLHASIADNIVGELPPIFTQLSGLTAIDMVSHLGEISR